MPTRNLYWGGVSFAIGTERQVPTTAFVHPGHLLHTLRAYEPEVTTADADSGEIRPRRGEADRRGSQP